MQNRTGTIHKTVFLAAIVSLFILIILLLLYWGGFFKRNQSIANQFDFAKVASKANAQCKSDTSNRCFKDFFSGFARLNKFETTKSVLDELIKINKSVRYCHGIAHEISIVEVQKNPQNWLNVFSYVPNSECSYGFFHGVIEGKYQTDPNLIVDSNLVETVCIKQLASAASRGSERSCAHAFGHIILVQAEGKVAEAINKCQSVDSRVKSPCFEGIFMEHIEKNNLSAHGIEVRAQWSKEYVDAEEKSCQDYSEDEQIECWRSLAPAIFTASNLDYVAAISQCNEADLYLSKRACTRKVLGQLLVDKFLDGIEPGVDYCRLFNIKAEYEVCLTDIISYVLLTSAEFKKQIEDYCSIVVEEAKDVCLQTVKRYTNY